MQKDYVYCNWRCWFGWAKSDVRCGDHADQPRRIIGPILEDARVYVLCLWLFWFTVVFWYRPAFITSHPWQISISRCMCSRECFDMLWLPRYSPLRWPWHFLVPQIGVRLRAGKKVCRRSAASENLSNNELESDTAAERKTILRVT